MITPVVDTFDFDQFHRTGCHAVREQPLPAAQHHREGHQEQPVDQPRR